VPRITRRRLLGLGAAGSLALVAPGCLSGSGAASRPGDRITYGEDASQYVQRFLPAGEPRGVVVVLHGGFWRAEYDASLGEPLAEALAAEGWAAWNLEYRRVGNPASGGGGGVPETLDDVAAGIDLLAEQDLDLSTVITLGHSAGGHLATWAAARGRFARWSAAAVPVTGVLAQAGVLDLRAASAAGLGGGAVDSFVGGGIDETVDPAQQLPLDVPVRCVHGRGDTIVPLEQSAFYVDACRAAGGDAELVEVDGDHFTVIEPSGPVWATQLALLDELVRG
jgi:acetyl esterase/lipase